MPQLNPSPWLYTMLASWLVLSTMIQPKILSFTPTTPPPHKTTSTTSTTPWTWPWT
uniref:ATP synthase complex subunit 8 n=1 Tax=Glaucidium cuculoides TaxID=543873 RepID=A0A1U9VYP9_9STRI|nr:ATP synthase F0 subunit 8 [Glaucidium cuculoides]AQY15766.1 ATP synthase F0 subunit 8 [Glaucidium cuculoides]